MALDPITFQNAARAQARRLDVIENRVHESDITEAKANIMVERTLNQPIDTDELYRELTETNDYVPVYDDDSNGGMEEGYSTFNLPPKETSGLLPEFPLDESQLAAINMMIQEQYCCMIGAAGSGKTTSTRAFLGKMIYGDEELGVEPHRVRMLEGKQGLNIALVAFTGIATQVIKANMPSWMHPAVKTIHSLLEYAPVSSEVIQKDGTLKEVNVFMPGRHAGNKLDHDIIIIDEASMVGFDLWHQILDASKPGTKIFMIGDLNQLPPVMSQSIFAYILAAWPVAELTHIHRQKEEAANKIVDVAHSILRGLEFQFDDPAKNHNWRVIGMEIDSNPQVAGRQIVSLANQLRSRKVHPTVDPTEPLIYDPYRDRIITAGNGYDDQNPNSMVQQFIINEALSLLIQPPAPDHPRYVIDAGLSRKKFAVGHRVMATKNESPDTVDRVTNGMVGVITEIVKNASWTGNPATVGPEEEVAAAKKKEIEEYMRRQQMSREEQVEEATKLLQADLGNLDFSKTQEKEKEGGGPASHRVTIQFANGALRDFSTKAQVDSLYLAYASTCHKCQGSQFDTAIIVCHHAVAMQLSREWFYTAVTRATKRVVLLYTKLGVRKALAKQRIFGRTLQEKIVKYKEMQEEGTGPLKVKVRLYI